MLKNKVAIFLPIILALSCTINNNVSTVKPTTSPTPNNSSSPTITPIPSVTPSLSPSVSASPTVVPTSTPTPTSIPSNTSDIKDFATINGYVRDDSGNVINGATVEIKCLDTSINWVGEKQQTIGGAYVFRNVPAGYRMEIKASNGNGWNERTIVYVAKSNLNGVPASNIVNFGDDLPTDDINKLNFDFLTKAVEVISVEPKREGVIKHYDFKIKFTFNKPIKKSLLEKYFVLRYLNELPPSNVTIGDGNSGTFKTDGPPNILGLSQVMIDQYYSNKKFDWNTPSYEPSGKEVTFSLLPGYGLPVRKDKRTIYGVSLRGIESDVKITDMSDNYPLKIGEFYTGTIGRSKNYVVYVDADQTEPYIDSLKLLKNNSNCIIRVVFSEPMKLQNFDNPELFDISNYTFTKNGTVITLSNPIITMPEPSTVEIRTDTNTFSENDTIKVDVNQNIKDPAGNFISQGLTLGEKDYSREAKFSSNS